MPFQLVSAAGVLVMLLLAWAACPRRLRRRIAWRTIGWGMVLLMAFAVIVLKTPARIAFSWANTAVNKMLDFTAAGAAFVFGELVTNRQTFGYIFAFQILPTIVFFGALMAVLYHLGVMPFLIRQMGRAIAKALKTSGAESFSTVADIFVGQTEAPLVIRPYVPSLTLSELMACMTAGFATTAGGVLIAYVAMLRDVVPDIGGHLIACSVMSAPAALVIAKLMLPETETPQTMGRAQIHIPRTSVNLLDAVTTGATDGMRLAVNVAIMLIAFIALTAMINFALGWVGDHVLHTPLSLERIFSWLLSPLALVMGVPLRDVPHVASLLGQKTVLNEFVAYSRMSQELASNPEWLTPRGRLIASYALCGFANFGSIGIQIGGYSSLAPSRRADLSRLGLRAMIGGTLTTCLVACVAGILL